MHMSHNSNVVHTTVSTWSELVKFFGFQTMIGHCRKIKIRTNNHTRNYKDMRFTH